MAYQQTSVRAYGILVRENRVVLVRATSRGAGAPVWWLPGGGLHFAETPEEALTREFEEETGLLIAEPDLMNVLSDVRRRPNGDQIHSVRVIYRVRLVGGQLRDEQEGSTDMARWFDVDALNEVNLAEYTRQALSLVLAK